MNRSSIASPALYEAVRDPKPEAIVVYCSDPRFYAASGEFIERELGFSKGKFVPLVIGGGAGVLGHPEQLPKEFKFMKERFELYRSIFPTLRHIILINHQDCRYYDSLKSRLFGFFGSRLKISPEHARADLNLVSKVFNRVLSHLGLTVDLYYARFADPEHRTIIFDRFGE